ncbi:hypothetical protein [Marinicella rhabdoformis]|uniref:hypothetical protein n=1 Tax=Marinicella rhabdoformis TaxID=2580566 RepID=UPI0012AEE053|nr:hypothetical protein [Marinicella rhabdoformis]
MDKTQNINKPLITGALLCALASLAHMGCIIFGADWYRFFGAGEQMARMAEQGLWYPTVVTSVLVTVLAIWSLYALSAAGVIRSLPLIRLALCLISAVFILRGIGFMELMPMFPENSLTFWYVSSAICLTIGLCFAVGTYQQWHKLR